MALRFRHTFFPLYRSLLPNPNFPISLFPFLKIFAIKASASFLPDPSCKENKRFHLFSAISSSSSSSSLMADNGVSDSSSSSAEKQFEDFRLQLEESGSIRERIRGTTMEMEKAIRLMQTSLLLVHQSRPFSEVLEKAQIQIDALKELFGQLAEILRECPGQYYRYNGGWRSEAQTVVSLLAFLHWLETGSLLTHTEAEEKLGLNASEFGLDIEDYLVGVCFMSNELPRYVVNQVTAGNYDCPRKVFEFLTDLHTAFRMLNLRNDFLRKKFDGMKYDLRRVEEVYYDVTLRGLTSKDSTGDQETEA